MRNIQTNQSQYRHSCTVFRTVYCWHRLVLPHISMIARTSTVTLSVSFVLFLTLLPATSVFAQTSDAISQSYQTTSTTISTGTLVSLISSGSNKVEPATNDSETRLVGIAVDKPVLSLTSTHTNSTAVQVAVGGTTDALVSDANGMVNAGDKITISPIDGIGMKAIGSGEVVGTAQQSLLGVKTVTKQFKGTNGNDVTVHVGLLPVAVNVVYYSASNSEGSVSAYTPPALQSLANSIAGKSVSPIRVLIATVALLLGFAAVITMLAVAIRSGVISLGRNPLAQSALRRGMIDILVAAVGVLLVTGVVVGAVVLT